jgi:hypothetical protein
MVSRAAGRKPKMSQNKLIRIKKKNQSVDLPESFFFTCN